MNQKPFSAKVFLVFLSCALAFGSSTILFHGQSYVSHVDTYEDVYFKVLALEKGISYNFTVDIEEWFQTDLGFSIHLEKRPAAKNALVTFDHPGTADESGLYTPNYNSSYFIRVYSNYDWGFFEITVKEELTGIEKVVEPYDPPTNLNWLWVIMGVFGGIIILAVIFSLITTLFTKIHWNNISLPKKPFRRFVYWWQSFISKLTKRQNTGKKTKQKQKLAKLRKKNRKKQGRLRISGNSFDESGSIRINEKLTKGLTCMVSNLPIRPIEDVVLACPYCESLAKQSNLIEWLQTKSLCPVCREKLSYEECRKVIFSI
jgi:hypothetical protein